MCMIAAQKLTRWAWSLSMVNPKDINFSQTTINKNFDNPDNFAKSLGQSKNNINIDKNANIIKNSGADNVMKNMKPIRVVNVKG